MPLEMPRPHDPVRMTIGLLILALGVALLLDRAGVIDAFGRSNFWPFAIIVVGLVKLADRPEHGPRQGGWWVFFGVWLLLNDMRLLRFRDSWPLFLVAIGISIVWNQIVPPRPRAPEKVE
jgi:LiaF transmembrane domain